MGVSPVAKSAPGPNPPAPSPSFTVTVCAVELTTIRSSLQSPFRSASDAAKGFAGTGTSTRTPSVKLWPEAVPGGAVRAAAAARQQAQVGEATLAPEQVPMRPGRLRMEIS